jgi:hypothetical protein
MYWVTHILALMAGTTLGAGIMSWIQINRMENDGLLGPSDTTCWRCGADRYRSRVP